MGMFKNFFRSDAGGVLAGPLVQKAAGGKPTLRGLADPEGVLKINQNPSGFMQGFQREPKPADPAEEERRRRALALSKQQSTIASGSTSEFI
jgi:hypothetical protein